MKKLILIAALFSAPTMADDFCSEIHRLGETMMEARQSGVDMMAIMGTLGNLEKELKPIVIEAYSHPRYSTQEVKKKVISEFANSLYLQCVKSQS